VALSKWTDRLSTSITASVLPHPDFRYSALELLRANSDLIEMAEVLPTIHELTLTNSPDSTPLPVGFPLFLFSIMR